MALTKNGATLLQKFGIKEDNGYEIFVGFVASPYRKSVDRITVIQQTRQTERTLKSGNIYSPYTQSLLDSCFKGW